MKKLLLLATLSVVAASPVMASPTPATWDALPCTEACHALFEDTCAAPPPDVFFDDIVLPPAPEGANGRSVVLQATIEPLGDWDLSACTASQETLAHGANILGEPCDNRLGQNSFVPVGCRESVSVPVSAGQVVILRAVNIAGEPTLHGTYMFTTI